MLELKDINKSYRMGGTRAGLEATELQVLRGVSLSIEAGDYVAIMGPSGSGKSTLMHILGLLDVPTSGSYKVEGREVALLSEDALSTLRRQVLGFIFQQFNLLPRMSAEENVALPLLYSEQKMDLKRSNELLEKVGLKERALHRPNELSGGQQQRVAIARALINRPMMILADEPTGNLDSTSEGEILQILQDLNDQGITIVIVTHEEEVGQKAKRVIRMRDGLIQSDIRQAPLHSRSATAPTSKSESETSVYAQMIELIEYFHQGYRTLLGNKVRTALSMLGILIGVASVVAMLALGAGAQRAIEEQLSSLGSNLLILRPGSLRVSGIAQGSGSANHLMLDDETMLKTQVDSVKASSSSVSGRVQATFGGKNWSTQVQGVGSAYGQMHATDPTLGRFFTSDENSKRARVAVIGMTLVRELFAEKNPLGEMIKINRVNFQVIGVLPPKGANGWRDQDDIILIPVETAMKRLLGRQFVDYIEFEIKDPSALDSAQEKLVDLMNTRHKVSPSQSEGAFEVRNMADIQAALTSSSKTLSMLLSSIAAISLLVGGIGIMNIMLVSVTERTKEIGLRKAVGAKRRDILAQFLAESVVVSSFGGLLGIFTGWLITVLLSTAVGWNTSISLNSVLLSFFFSTAIGIIFGIYPATKASRLHPIDALRYE